MIKPTHPGEFFYLEVMIPQNLSVNDVARKIRVSESDLSQVLCGTKSIDRRIARGMARITRTTLKSWLNMQKRLHHWEMSHGERAPRFNRKTLRAFRDAEKWKNMHTFDSTEEFMHWLKS